jgi:tellurite resistance protein
MTGSGTTDPARELDEARDLALDEIEAARRKALAEVEPEAKTPIGRWVQRHSWKIVTALLAVDVLTLVIAAVIGINQHSSIQTANDAAHDAKVAAHRANHAVMQVKARTCHNSGSLIATDKRQIAGYNRQLALLSVSQIQAFLPNTPTAAAQAIIDQQVKQFNESKAAAYREITHLGEGCTEQQLRVN